LSEEEEAGILGGNARRKIRIYIIFLALFKHQSDKKSWGALSKGLSDLETTCDPPEGFNEITALLSPDCLYLRGRSVLQEPQSVELVRVCVWLNGKEVQPLHTILAVFPALGLIYTVRAGLPAPIPPPLTHPSLQDEARSLNVSLHGRNLQPVGPGS
jgi:hypothetical protein